MPELLLHYIWMKGIFLPFPQSTIDGRPIRVLSLGQHNRQVGPDFENVHLMIGDQEWFGSVEMHLRSSDWYRHHHDLNKAYDGVILHVVRDADRAVFSTDGNPIPQCALCYPQDRDYLQGLMAGCTDPDSPFNALSCGRQLLSHPDIITRGWRDTLLDQRMECKADAIRRILEIKSQDWNEAFYITLSRNFGFHTNSLPFEQLALQTPLSYLNKHRDSLFQLTAILLGQSGLLDPAFGEVSGFRRIMTAEETELWNEYCFLRKKFSLTPLDPSVWRRGRVRPQNRPELRIRQFAQLIYQSEFLFSRLMEADSVDRMRELFILSPDPVEMDSRVMPVQPLGLSSIDGILINTVLPYRYAYEQIGGRHHAVSTRDLMEAVPAEDNNIIRQWRQLGQRAVSAADTQALIHLYQNYCQNSRCVHCDVGWQVFLQAEEK